jgi:hypothetical protein
MLLSAGLLRCATIIFVSPGPCPRHSARLLLILQNVAPTVGTDALPTPGIGRLAAMLGAGRLLTPTRPLVFLLPVQDCYAMTNSKKRSSTTYRFLTPQKLQNAQKLAELQQTPSPIIPSNRSSIPRRFPALLGSAMGPPR